MSIRILVSLFGILWFSLTTRAAPIILSESQDDYWIPSHYLWLEDKNNQWTIDHVSDSAFGKHFIAFSDSAVIGNNGQATTWWLKIELVDSTAHQNGWILENYDGSADAFSLYYKNEQGEWDSAYSGDATPFSQKAVEHKNTPFHLPFLSKSGVNEVYCKIQSKHHTSFVLHIRPAVSFLNYALKEYYYLGVFYGLMICMALFNLFLFVNTRRKAFLAYVFYALANAFYSMKMDGMGFAFFWPDLPILNAIPLQAFLLLLVVAMLFYTKNFLDLKSRAPKLNTVFNYVMVARTLIFFLAWLRIPPFASYEWYDVIIFAMAFFAGVHTYRKGYVAAKFFILGFLSLFVGYLIFALWHNGYIEGTVFTVYALNGATLLEMIFLSNAISVGVRQLDEESRERQQRLIKELKTNETLKDKVNRELESKVNERTKELIAANEQLKNQQHEIERINKLLIDENVDLQHEKQELSEARFLLKDTSFTEFQAVFPDEDKCFAYLADMKWKDVSWKCPKCKYDKYGPGKAPYSRRCGKCNYQESVTVDTIFYRLKFPIIKAFYMVFLIHEKPNITTEELSNTVDLRPNTCWAFKKKVMEAGRKNKKSQADGWRSLVQTKKK